MDKVKPTAMASNQDVLKLYLLTQFKSGYILVIHHPYDDVVSGSWVDQRLDVWNHVENIPDYLFLHFDNYDEPYGIITEMPKVETYGTLWAHLGDRVMLLRSNT